jgi:glucose-1-phosphate adenylyltransferase
VQEGEGPGFYIRDGIVVILKNAEIPDGTVI